MGLRFSDSGRGLPVSHGVLLVQVSSYAWSGTWAWWRCKKQSLESSGRLRTQRWSSCLERILAIVYNARNKLREQCSGLIDPPRPKSTPPLGKSCSGLYQSGTGCQKEAPRLCCDKRIASGPRENSSMKRKEQNTNSPRQGKHCEGTYSYLHSCIHSSYWKTIVGRGYYLGSFAEPLRIGWVVCPFYP